MLIIIPGLVWRRRSARWGSLRITQHLDAFLSVLREVSLIQIQKYVLLFVILLISEMKE